MAATAKALGRVLVSSAGSAFDIYTTPGAMVSRVSEVLLFNDHTASVLCRILFGGIIAWEGTLLTRESFQFECNTFLNATEKIQVYAATINVINVHASGVEDVNN